MEPEGLDGPGDWPLGISSSSSRRSKASTSKAGEDVRRDLVVVWRCGDTSASSRRDSALGSSFRETGALELFGEVACRLASASSSCRRKTGS